MLKRGKKQNCLHCSLEQKSCKWRNGMKETEQNHKILWAGKDLLRTSSPTVNAAPSLCSPLNHVLKGKSLAVYCMGYNI